MKNQKKFKGFTLLELLITLVIVGILATVGVPSFNGLIRDSRMTANNNDLLTALNYARSEAITLNQEVTILSKSGTDGDWGDGWDVFIDTDGDKTIDNTEEVLKSHEALSSNFTLKTSTLIQLKKSITYETTGLMEGTIGGTFYLCENLDASSARAVTINNVGRANSGSATQCQ